MEVRHNHQKDCDTDWALYHMLTEGKPMTIAELVKLSGWSKDIIKASLSRLENYCLIAVTDETIRLLSLPDILMMNEMRQASDISVYIENGIIKAKKQC
ncbi:MAG TPA: MarR family transcriptional regulator [Methanocorpusculum sp.]|nr:MarR family transcriptional regulator [Methanocorpusculum sp.]